MSSGIHAYKDEETGETARFRIGPDRTRSEASCTRRS
jgi:hypothetical protein